MKIRSAELSDVSDLCELLAILFEQEIEFKPNHAAQIAGLTEIIKNREIGKILVIEKDSKIIGMVNLLYTISTALGSRVAILEDMVVIKEHRGEGLGTALLKAAIQEAKEVGCKRITLLTDNGNVAAHNYYKKQGFIHSPMIPMRLTIK